jgi:hypothetical protein
MPTLTVIKHFDVIKNIAAGFFPRSVGLFFIRSRFSNWKKLSATALSWQLPRRLMLPSRPCDFRNDCHSWLCTDCPDPSEPAPVFGITPPYSHQQCVQDNVLCHPGLHGPADNFA